MSILKDGLDLKIKWFYNKCWNKMNNSVTIKVTRH